MPIRGFGLNGWTFDAALLDTPPAICQTFYGLGKLRSADTPDVIQEFYFYIGIFSLSFDISQRGCDGSADDCPPMFQNNVRRSPAACWAQPSSMSSRRLFRANGIPRPRSVECAAPRRRMRGPAA